VVLITGVHCQHMREDKSDAECMVDSELSLLVNDSIPWRPTNTAT